MSKISIIVPVYNVENYINRCIESVIFQNYSDYELILIDDGSTDNSGIICDNYSKQYDNIISVHKDNHGVSSARNVGLSIAKGKYITFLDADDFLNCDFLKEIIKYKTDFVCQTANILDERGVLLYKAKYENEFYYNRKIICQNIKEILLSGRLNWAHCKLYDSSIIKKHNIKFDETINFGEDTLFTIEYIKHINSLAIDNNANYNYVIYSSRKTLSNSITSKQIEMAKNVNKKIIELLRNNITETENLYHQRMSSIYNDVIEKNINNLNLFTIFSAYKKLLLIIYDDEFYKICRNNKEIIRLPNIIKNHIAKNSKITLKLLLLIYVMYKLF